MNKHKAAVSSYLDDDAIKDDIKSAISVETLCRHFNIDLSKAKKSGAEYNMRCPLPDHDDNSPSFSINGQNLLWMCQGCGRTGDVFDFIGEMQRLSTKTDFLEIKGIAAGMAGIVLDAEGHGRRATNEEILKKVNVYINAEDSIKAKAIEAYKRKKGIDVTTLHTAWGAEQTQEGDYDIMVPMRDLDLSGRIVGGQRGRKRMLPSSSMGLFYVPEDIKRRGSDVFLVEGLSDYLSMLAAGYHNTIGIASASLKTRMLAKQLCKYKTVHIVFDLDRHKIGDDEQGGFQGAKKAMTLVREINKNTTQCRVYFLGKDYKFDVNDLFTDGGRPALEKFLTTHIADLNEYANEVGLAEDPEGYTAAKMMMNESVYAIEAERKFYWHCSADTKWVWKKTSKGLVQKRIVDYLIKTRTSGHTTKLINETFQFLCIEASVNAAGLKQGLLHGGENESLAKKENVRICMKDGFYYPFRSEYNRFQAYKPEDYVFSTIDIDYEQVRRRIGRKEETPKRFMDFLQSIFEGDEDCEERIRFIRQWVGYSCVPADPYEKVLFIIGGGGNGKSTLLGAIGNILGTENYTNIPIEKLATDRFAASSLLGKYMNLCTEEKKPVLSSPLFKQLTGGDVITAEAKFEASFQFVPFCKFIVASNEEPMAAEDEPWLQRRLQMISFNNSFRGKMKDTTLKEYLKFIKIAIFEWGMKGLEDLVDNGFAVPPSSLATTKEFLSSSDYMAGFLEYKNASPIRKAETNMYQVYIMFTEYMKISEGRSAQFVPQRKKFAKQLEKKGYTFKVIGNVPRILPPDDDGISIDDFFAEN